MKVQLPYREGQTASAATKNVIIMAGFVRTFYQINRYYFVNVFQELVMFFQRNTQRVAGKGVKLNRDAK